MARVVVDVEEVEVDGDRGQVPGLEVTCPLCGHTAEAYGTSERSLRYALTMLAQDCGRKPGNFYVGDPSFMTDD